MEKIVRWLDDEIPRNQIPTLKRDLLGVVRFLRWVKAKVVSFEVESKEWIRILLHQMCVAIDVATDGHEEDFFPRDGKQAVPSASLRRRELLVDSYVTTTALLSTVA
ncbi:hypothetical protein Tco_1319740 [Tanacetum coccineum]